MANPYETQGMFSWFELVCDDTQKAKEFYAQVVGWEFEEDSEYPEYTLIKAQGNEYPIAGILPKSQLMIPDQNIPSHWGCYITVTDIEEKVAKVAQLGGNIIVPPTPVPKIGTFAVIQDPQGAVVSLMEYSMKCE